MSALHGSVTMLPMLRSVTTTSADRDPASRQFLPWQDAFETQDDVTSATSNHPEVTSRSTLVGILPGNGRILCGVAVLESDLYVVRNFSSAIDVYDVRTRDFRSRGGTEVAGLRDPVDVAACPVTGTVYVSGSNDMSIFKIDGRSKSVTGRWRLDRRPFGVSVTRSGPNPTVVVTFLDETAVREFSADGEELRGVRMDPDLFANPWHAVSFHGGPADSSDRVLICHGWSKDPLTCVSVVEVTGGEGRLVARYGGARGTGRAAMDLPSHAVVVPDGSGDRSALVVDLNNSRVLRLRLPSGTTEDDDYRPEVDSVLLSDADGLKWPRSLAFDERRQRLFVGLHEGPVLVFDYRPNN